MLAFAKVVGEERVGVDFEAGDVNLSAYAALMGDQNLVVTIINKDRERDAQVRIDTDGRYRVAGVKRLTAPGLDAKEGVVFGAEDFKTVPAGSATVVTMIAH